MKKILFALLSVSLLAGCATIVTGSNQNVKISVDQKKAQITVTAQTGQEFYQGAPTSLELPRKNTYTVEVKVDGYATQKVMITQGFNGWFVGNLCFGGIPGGIVDILTGAMWTLEPDTINIKMKTALLDTADGPVLVFFAIDQDGEMRSLSVPMIKA